MKTIHILILSAIAALTIFKGEQGFAQSKSGLEEAKKEIAANNAVYHQSFTKNDSTIFLNSYTGDACVMPPNSPYVCGRPELAKFFRGGYNAGVRSGNFHTTKSMEMGSIMLRKKELDRSLMPPVN